MAVKFLDTITWPKVVLLVIVILIVTRLVSPETAQWIMSPIVALAGAAIQAFQDFGG